MKHCRRSSDDQYVKYLNTICSIYVNRGTGMIASSSTFRPHPGRVIRDLFRLLDAVYPGSSAQQRSQCSTPISAGADVGCGSLK